MFNSCTHPLGLDTIDESNSDPRGKIRVFAKILKVSAIQRCAINIDARRQKKMNAFSPCIPTEFCPHLLGECWVPGGRQSNSARYCVVGAKVTHSKRSIRHFEARHIQSGHATGERSINSAQEVNLLLKSHLADDCLHPRFNVSRCCLCGRQSRQK